MNLPDGSVEVRACGDDDAIDALRDWLHQGPRHASVAGVTETPTTCSGPDRFTTR
jgi:acylphosphatase